MHLSNEYQAPVAGQTEKVRATNESRRDASASLPFHIGEWNLVSYDHDPQNAIFEEQRGCTKASLLYGGVICRGGGKTRCRPAPHRGDQAKHEASVPHASVCSLFPIAHVVVESDADGRQSFVSNRDAFSSANDPKNCRNGQRKWHPHC